MTRYLTRAVINRNAPEHALVPLLNPHNRNEAMDAHHRLMWTLFPDPAAKRDFLWRADTKGVFIILSTRKPQNLSLFDPLESKPFTPDLSVGDRLKFILRANATKDRRSNPEEELVLGTKRKPRKDRRVDIVMNALHTQGITSHRTGSESRSAKRMDVANEAANKWLNKQGQLRGFAIDTMTVDDYHVCKLKRKNGNKATFGVIDVRGILTVRDSEVFAKALYMGFGRAKAFGCGLMLIRRA